MGGARCTTEAAQPSIDQDQARSKLDEDWALNHKAKAWMEHSINQQAHDQTQTCNWLFHILASGARML